MSRRVEHCRISEGRLFNEFILWARTANWMAMPLDRNHGWEILRLYKVGTNTTVVYYRRKDKSITSAFIGRGLVEQFLDERKAALDGFYNFR